MTKQEAHREAILTGRTWESDRARKRRKRRERAIREAQRHPSAQLLRDAAAFAERDDAARARHRVRIEPAPGGGGRVLPKPEPVTIYNESARSLLGY